MKHRLSKEIVGFDLEDQKHVISVLERKSGKVVEERTITNHRAEKKAVIARARKLAVVMLGLMKTGGKYEALRSSA